MPSVQRRGRTLARIGSVATNLVALPLQLLEEVAFAEAHAYDADGELLGSATTSLAITSPS